MKPARLYKLPQVSLRMVREKTIKVAHKRFEAPVHAAEFFQPLIGDRPIEYMMAALLDGTGTVTSVVTLAQGGMHGMGLTVRDVLRAALVGQASAFVLCHNHPSGVAAPSREDIEFTRKIQEAAKLVQVPLLDHVIVTRDAFSTVIPFHLEEP